MPVPVLILPTKSTTPTLPASNATGPMAAALRTANLPDAVQTVRNAAIDTRKINLDAIIANGTTAMNAVNSQMADAHRIAVRMATAIETTGWTGAAW